jgi:hypothetical protein
MSLWQIFIAFLTWLSASPAAVDLEQPRAAAAVAAAYATFAEAEPEPAPAPSKCVCGGTCKNGVWKPDGRIEQPCPCPATCACKSGKCPDGRCKL